MFYCFLILIFSSCFTIISRVTTTTSQLSSQNILRINLLYLDKDKWNIFLENKEDSVTYPETFRAFMDSIILIHVGEEYWERIASAINMSNYDFFTPSPWLARVYYTRPIPFYYDITIWFINNKGKYDAIRLEFYEDKYFAFTNDRFYDLTDEAKNIIKVFEEIIDKTNNIH
jgi:hypothetical protein